MNIKKVNGKEITGVYEASSLDELEGYTPQNVTRVTKWFSVPIEVANKCSPMACLLYAHFVGYSNGLFRGSNEYLRQALGLESIRQLSRLIKELADKGCIEIVYVNKSTRFIYPLYVLPYILDVKTKKKKLDTDFLNKKDDDKKDDYNDEGLRTGGFTIL